MSSHLDRASQRMWAYLAAHPEIPEEEHAALYQDTLDNPEYYPHIWRDEWESATPSERADYWEWVDGL
jgi:hypothetical protein